MMESTISFKNELSSFVNQKNVKEEITMDKYVIISKNYDTMISYHYTLDNITPTYNEAMQFIFAEVNDKYLSKDKKYKLHYISENIIAISYRVTAFRDEYIKQWIIIKVSSRLPLEKLKKRDIVISQKNNNYSIFSIDDDENDVRQDISDYLKRAYDFSYENNCKTETRILKCDNITIQKSNNYRICDAKTEKVIEELIILK